jgi:hypothetical protein
MRLLTAAAAAAAADRCTFAADAAIAVGKTNATRTSWHSLPLAEAAMDGIADTVLH